MSGMNGGSLSGIGIPPFFSRYHEPGIMFGISSDHSGLISARSPFDFMGGHLPEHCPVNRRQFPKRFDRQGRGKADHGPQGIYKAQPHRLHAVRGGRLEHEASHHIQGGHPGGDLLADTLGTLTPEHVGDGNSDPTRDCFD